MDKSILLQKQVRDNSEDLRSYLKDLQTWEEDMKRKESELSNNNDLPEVPIPRTKVKKTETKKEEIKKEKAKKIKSYDYAAWDKFDVEAECEKIDAEKKDTESDEEPSEEYKNSLRDEAIFEKEKGNQFVKNKKWDEAIACYTHSIACYSKDPIFYANRALCFLKKNDLRSAEADCTSALQLDSTYVKALQRRAVAREGLKQYQESLDDLKRVLELEPHNKESRIELDRLEKRLGIAKQIPVDSKTEKVIAKTEKVIKSVETKTKTNFETKLNASPVENKPIKQEIVTAEKSTAVPEKKALPKQIPWPDRPNAEIILPISKLPHQRSKKPLRKIEILESDNSDVNISKKTSEFNSLNLDYDENNSLAKILAQSNQLDVDEILKDIENNVDDEINNKITNSETKNRSNLTISSSTKPNIQTVETSPNIIGDSNATFNFPVPKSSVQFYSNWKVMKNYQEQKFIYLSKINPTELPKIFQDSLESDVFSDIIVILSENFIEKNFQTFPYLQSLSNVKRFSALTMFMSNKDKICLKKIFDHCEKKNECSKEDIDKLRKKYEIK